jgi:hypothetical protein
MRIQYVEVPEDQVIGSYTSGLKMANENERVERVVSFYDPAKRTFVFKLYVELRADNDLPRHG